MCTTTIRRCGAIVLFTMILVAHGYAANPPLVRQPNTSLAMPSQPPQFGYQASNAFPSLTFVEPLAIASPPGESNRLFVAEQGGKIWVITNLQSPTKTLFLDMSSLVTTNPAYFPVAEGGLQSFTFHPGFATNGFFYVTYMAEGNLPQGNGLYNRLSRFQVSPTNLNFASPSSLTPVIVQFDDEFSHNMNDVKFGPDGYLYVSLGDESHPDDVLNNSQRIDKDFFSGIIRLDVDKRPGSLPPNPHPASTTNYLVPSDNPFVGATNFNGSSVNPASVRSEFWAVGLRNPWRMSFDPANGQLFCGDVGQGKREEVDLIVKGGNYGWAFREGTIAGPNTPPPGFTSVPPVLDYAHGAATDQGECVVGGMVYRGAQLSQLYGSYIFADYISGHIWRLRLNGTNLLDWSRLTTEAGIVSFAADPRDDGILMADRVDGVIRKLVYNSTPVGTPLPPTLAAAGVFTNLTTLTPHSGIVPYSLNLPFWSDNAIKTRWFSIPNTNLDMAYSTNGNWAFPTGTVWVKHFEIELTNGAPASRRRLETRLLVKNTNGVYGVTYKWDAAQTNAVLVGEAGEEESIAINEGGGLVRTQRWIYPGRAQCLACHTAVGGEALGFGTRQLNRDHAYPGGTTNQIAALSAAGYFTTPVSTPDPQLILAHATNQNFTLEHRFRSYLQANCSQCHQPGGSGRGSWDARITTPLHQANIVNGTIIENLGDPDNRVIKPGSFEHSVLLTRISDSSSGRMPPLGSTVLDTNGINLVRSYIMSLARIMPIGDSITQGETGRNSYRRRLWQLLTNGGLNVDFVGSLTNVYGGGPPRDPDFDLDHEGHSGWRTDEVLAQIDGWASNAQPSYALIHLGSNDAFQNQSTSSTTNELSQLIDRLRLVNPSIRVLLAKLIPAADPAWSSRIAALNAEIPTLAAGKSTPASPVLVVDHTVGFSTNYLYDGVHPDDEGERRMATNWFNVLTALLTGSNTLPSITLTFPTNGAVLTAPGNFAMEANVTDLAGTVTGVDFFVNGVLAGRDVTPPYSVAWSNVVAGSYTVYGIARSSAAGDVASSPAVITVTSGPAAGFFRGINVFGGAVFIGNSLWSAYSEALSSGFSVSSVSTFSGTYAFPLVPAPDAGTLQMLQSGIYVPRARNGQGIQMAQTLSNGNYRVSVWLLENHQSNYRNMNLVLEGSTVATNIGDLPLGHWAKYGPYNTTVSDGQLNVGLLRVSKGDPSVYGLLIEQVVTVPTNIVPSVTITSPAAGQVLALNAPIGIQANATDDLGVASVEFFADGASLGVDPIAPYAATWNPSAPGVHFLSAKATDSLGLMATSTVIQVTVTNLAPVANLVTPTNGAVIPPGVPIALQATASDGDGSVVQVEFFAGTNSLGVDSNAPFGLVWNTSWPGNHALSVRATDNFGLTGMSTPVMITVSNTPPTVAVSNPTNGVLLPFPTAFELTAVAGDVDGAVNSVEFFANGVWLGQGTGSNWLFQWTNGSVGTHSLTAVATDNLGVFATSAPVNVRLALVPWLQVYAVSNAGFRVRLSGESNAFYRLDFATNPGVWLPVHTNVTTNGILEWIDTNAGPELKRFYRGVTLP